MFDAPFALAFTAGLVSTVNPCGFAMLPAYLSYFMGLNDDEAGPDPVVRGLSVGAVVAAGFLVVFGVVGILITLGLRSIIDWIPWVSIVIGVLISILGVAMLFFGYEPTIAVPKLNKGGQSRKIGSVFTFGVSYAVASLSCTLPVFLTVVAGAIPNSGLIDGVLLFLVYGFGMSLVLVAVTLALALGKQRIVGWLRGSARYVHRVSGAILLLAGGFIIWFWVTNINDPLQQNSSFLQIERFSSDVTELIGNNALASGLIFGGILAAAIAWLVWRAYRGGDEDQGPTEDARQADEVPVG